MASPGAWNVPVVDEASRLQELNADFRNQDDLESDITKRADMMLAEKAEENDAKPLEKVLGDKQQVDSQIRQARQGLTKQVNANTRHRLKNELRKQEYRRTGLIADLKDITDRIDERRKSKEIGAGSHGPGRLPNETRRDYLLRTGKITPFNLMNAASHRVQPSTLQNALMDVEDQHDEQEEQIKAELEPEAHRFLNRPGIDFDQVSESSRKAVGSAETW